MFDGHTCRLCHVPIFSGTGKAEHAKMHMRNGNYGNVERVGAGTTENPYRYVLTTSANGSNEKVQV